jgi:hypothetical protein
LRYPSGRKAAGGRWSRSGCRRDQPEHIGGRRGLCIIPQPGKARATYVRIEHQQLIEGIPLGVCQTVRQSLKGFLASAYPSCKSDPLQYYRSPDPASPLSPSSPYGAPSGARPRLQARHQPSRRAARPVPRADLPSPADDRGRTEMTPAALQARLRYPGDRSKAARARGATRRRSKSPRAFVEALCSQPLSIPRSIQNPLCPRPPSTPQCAQQSGADLVSFADDATALVGYVLSPAGRAALGIRHRVNRVGVSTIGHATSIVEYVGAPWRYGAPNRSSGYPVVT